MSLNKNINAEKTKTIHNTKFNSTDELLIKNPFMNDMNESIDTDEDMVNKSYYDGNKINVLHTNRLLVKKRTVERGGARITDPLELADPLNTESNTFLDEADSGRSEEFLAVKRALREMQDDEDEEYEDVNHHTIQARGLASQIRDKELTFGTGDKYVKFLKLNEALSVYRAGHFSPTFGPGKKRYISATKLNKMLTDVAKEMLKDNGVKMDQPYFNDLSPKEKSNAKSHALSVAKYYRKYCMRLAEDIIPSYEERLRSRWNVLKTCERDIRIMMQEHDANGGELTDSEAYIIDEYESVRSQLTLLELSKKQGEQKAHENTLGTKIRNHAFQMMTEEDAPKQEESKPNVYEDEGLEKEQLIGLERIDAWVLRNIQNGGYMTFGLNVSDRSHFAARLFAMTKRQRLYAYYLVETRERVNRTPEGLAKSQSAYVPNLSAFKEHMVANRLKFYKRFSGGYVYWAKLAQAVDITEGSADAMELVNGLLKEIKDDKKKKKNIIDEDEDDNIITNKIKEDDDEEDEEENISKNNIISTKMKEDDEEEEEKSMDKSLLSNKSENDSEDEGDDDIDEAPRLQSQLRDSVKELLKTLLQEMQVEEQLKKGKFENGQEAQLKAEQLRLQGERIKQANQVGALNDKMSQSQVKASKEKSDTTKKFLNQYTGNLSKAGLSGTIIAKYVRNETMLVNNLVHTCTTSAISGLSGVATLVGATFNVMRLLSSSERKKMTNFDFAAGIGGLVTSTASLVNSGTTLAGLAVDNPFVTFAGGGPGVLVVSSIGTAVSAIQVGSYFRDRSHRSNANDLVNPNDKMAMGMMKLNKILDERQRTQAFSNFLTCSASTTVSALVVAGTLVPLFSGIMVGAGLITAVAMNIRDHCLMKKMRSSMNDSFFEMDTFQNEVEQEWERQHGKRLTAKQKEKLKNEVMRRMAADLGFYSPNHLATAVARKFAEYLYLGANADGDNAEMCQEMIRGLGLIFEKDEQNPNNTIPTVADITAKLCS